jgi:uncharacterized membrane protein YedE/YeeE
MLIGQLLGFSLDLSDPVTLVAVILSAAVLIVAGRYVVAYLNTSEMADDRFQMATNRTARWLGMLFGGVVVAIGTGLVQGADILGMAANFVGGHPFIVSNLAGISLGAGALSGVFQLTVDQYVGIAMMIVAGVFLLQGVYGDAA